MARVETIIFWTHILSRSGINTSRADICRREQAFIIIYIIFVIIARRVLIYMINTFLFRYRTLSLPHAFPPTLTINTAEVTALLMTRLRLPPANIYAIFIR